MVLMISHMFFAEVLGVFFSEYFIKVFACERQLFRLAFAQGEIGEVNDSLDGRHRFNR